MLAVLRVAPLLPSPTLRAVARVMSGRDGKAGSYRSNWKAEFAGTLLERASRTHGRSSRPSVMHFYSGPPCILSPALTADRRNHRPALQAGYQAGATRSGDTTGERSDRLEGYMP